MRLACDTGGTFTDLLVEDDGGAIRMFKAPTTPADPVLGVLDALKLAAADRGESLRQLLSRSETLIHGTTHAINAIVTNTTATTAFLTTAGHPDILVLREGGRTEPFNFTVAYPKPYVPRALTFQVPERVDSAGRIRTPLDEQAVIEIASDLQQRRVEAVAVCLLWSVINPVHERRVGELLDEYLPGVPYTLSHLLNPILREYRRASATAIDASLKPLMAAYLRGLTARLHAAGFSGRTLVLTSQGGVLDADSLAQAPIHAINSGPSMAPVAARHYATLDSDLPNVIVADTGGTTYDVSLVRAGRIPVTKETWLGQPFRSHLTGFSSIDIKSIGAGGGSIAWVDDGGVLHVGPQSAGAAPGPVCYASGGTEPTLTDAALVLGYIDPDYFLAGSMKLDAVEAAEAVAKRVAEPMGMALEEAATAIIDVVTENMVQAIADITVNQGIAPSESVLVAGGGGAGLNATLIARRLGCREVIVPEVGAALSAAGALMSDLTIDFQAPLFTTSEHFAISEVNALLNDLAQRCRRFIDGPGAGSVFQSVEYTVEARYAHQVWEIDVPLRVDRFESAEDVDVLVDDFHAAHEALFAIRDPGSTIEMVGWRATVRCRLRDRDFGRLHISTRPSRTAPTRLAYFRDFGHVEAPVHHFDSLSAGRVYRGPAIIESPFTTIVADPGSNFERTHVGNVRMRV